MSAAFNAKDRVRQFINKRLWTANKQQLNQTPLTQQDIDRVEKPQRELTVRLQAITEK